MVRKRFASAGEARRDAAFAAWRRELRLQPLDERLEGDDVGARPAGAVDDLVTLHDAWQRPPQMLFEQRHARRHGARRSRPPRQSQLGCGERAGRRGEVGRRRSPRRAASRPGPRRPGAVRAGRGSASPGRARADARCPTTTARSLRARCADAAWRWVRPSLATAAAVHRWSPAHAARGSRDRFDDAGMSGRTAVRR